MRLTAIPLVVLCVSMAFASDDTWPSKGDTVFIAASFKKLTAPSPVGGATMQYNMPPCAKLEIGKANLKKLKWVTKDPVGGTERLEGGWVARMHKNKEACEAQMSSDGEPSVVQSGARFKIKPSKSQ